MQERVSPVRNIISYISTPAVGLRNNLLRTKLKMLDDIVEGARAAKLEIRKKDQRSYHPNLPIALGVAVAGAVEEAVPEADGAEEDEGDADPAVAEEIAAPEPDDAKAADGDTDSADGAVAAVEASAPEVVAVAAVAVAIEVAVPEAGCAEADDADTDADSGAAAEETLEDDDAEYDDGVADSAAEDDLLLELAVVASNGKRCRMCSEPAKATSLELG